MECVECCCALEGWRMVVTGGSTVCVETSGRGKWKAEVKW